MDAHDIAVFDLVALSAGQLEALELILASKGIPYERRGHLVEVPALRTDEVAELVDHVELAVDRTEGMRSGDALARTHLMRQASPYLPIPRGWRNVLQATGHLRRRLAVRVVVGLAVLVLVIAAIERFVS